MTAVNIDLGALKRSLLSNSVTLDEFRKIARDQTRRTRATMAHWGQGTPTHKRKWQNGRPRRVIDGRVYHMTKGFAKSERGGYVRRGRRSNRT